MRYTSISSQKREHPSQDGERFLHRIAKDLRILVVVLSESPSWIEATEGKKTSEKAFWIKPPHSHAGQILRQLFERRRRCTFAAKERLMNGGPFERFTRLIDAVVDLLSNLTILGFDQVERNRILTNARTRVKDHSAILFFSSMLPAIHPLVQLCAIEELRQWYPNRRNFAGRGRWLESLVLGVKIKNMGI